jgi:hypothetical protein
MTTPMLEQVGWNRIDISASAQDKAKAALRDNRFGRHYSPEAFVERVYKPTVAAGLRARLFKVRGWRDIHPDLWLRRILLIERQ